MTGVQTCALPILSYTPNAAVDRSTPPHSGSVGCAAKINAVMPLEDGRMNIVSTGLIRYKVLAVSRESPFVLARVESITDEIEPEDEFKHLVEEVGEASKKFVEMGRALDELGPLPNELPEDAESLSLLIASALPIDTDSKQNLLEITSTRSRLSRLRQYLAATNSSFDHRLKSRERARRNGHGKLDQESINL